MSDENDDAIPVFNDRAARREEIVARFEETWQRKERPSIDDYLAGEGEERLSILVELVHVDLERRLNTKEPARVEEYLEPYPELAQDDDKVLELLSAEYGLRLRNEPKLAIDEYVERFPQYREKLVSRLAKTSSSRPQRRFPLRLNCPHCQNPIVIVDNVAREEEEVVCPTCGSSFHLEQGQTASWRPEKLPSLGKFELLQAVGRGAFGTVYRARDTELDRIVAVKVPPSGAFATEEDEDRFVREARTAAQLSHS